MTMGAYIWLSGRPAASSFFWFDLPPSASAGFFETSKFNAHLELEERKKTNKQRRKQKIKHNFLACINLILNAKIQY